MDWILKSESDLDRVYVEVDDEGNETGECLYAWADGRVQEVGPEGVRPVVDIPAQITTWFNASVPYDWKSDPVMEVEQDDAFLDHLDPVNTRWLPVLWLAAATVWIVLVVLSLRVFGL